MKKKDQACSTCSRWAPRGRGPDAKHLTPSDLPAHSKEHLDYEIGMLVDTARAWNLCLAEPIRNALTEAFAVHLRNLIEFLYPRGEVCGNVSAKDFFASPSKWDPPLMSTALETARQRAHREIVHLTVDRVPGSQKGKEWDPSLIDDLLIPLKEFVEVADGDRLHRDVKDRVLRLTAQAKPIAIPGGKNMITDVYTGHPAVPSTTWGNQALGNH